MTRDEFLEKLESLLEFNHKSIVCMYSYDLIVMSSKNFFEFYDADSGMQGCISYSEIIDVELVNDDIRGLYLYLDLISGELYIPASGFDVKTGVTIRTVELYEPYRRAWVVQELEENQVLVVFAICKKEAVYQALSLFEFDLNDILDNRIPYTVDMLPGNTAWGEVISNKDHLDPANEDDWEILKQCGFYYDEENHIQYSFLD